MKGRHISNNLRLVLDLVEYCDLLDDFPDILFLDFQKAFDIVSHNFIFDCLKHLKFGHFFVDAIRTLYNGGNSCIKLCHGTSSRFNIYKGIRQGCPISPFLFLLVHQSPFEGITFQAREIKISQLADDTSLFLKNVSQARLALDIVKQFSKTSGLALNLSKCEMFVLKGAVNPSGCNISEKDIVTYLGVKITKNLKAVNDLNLSPVTESVKKKFSSWLGRDLSLQGRVLLSKAEGLSRASYLFSS
uniref:Reverse transcriptase domain-containing protein n=1 Tax=Hucho hucho TaxID=62062 RepID=A0A4W5LQJ3_9TELE